MPFSQLRNIFFLLGLAAALAACSQPAEGDESALLGSADGSDAQTADTGSGADSELPEADAADDTGAPDDASGSGEEGSGTPPEGPLGAVRSSANFDDNEAGIVAAATVRRWIAEAENGEAEGELIILQFGPAQAEGGFLPSLPGIRTYDAPNLATLVQERSNGLFAAQIAPGRGTRIDSFLRNFAINPATDRILIADLELSSHIGVPAAERAAAQRARQQQPQQAGLAQRVHHVRRDLAGPLGLGHAGFDHGPETTRALDIVDVFGGRDGRQCARGRHAVLPRDGLTVTDRSPLIKVLIKGPSMEHTTPVALMIMIAPLEWRAPIERSFSSYFPAAAIISRLAFAPSITNDTSAPPRRNWMPCFRNFSIRSLE